MPGFTVLLFFAAFAAPHVFGQADTNSEVDNLSSWAVLQRFEALGRGLSNYGDACAYRAEQIRQDYARSVLRNRHDVRSLIRIARTGVANNEPLCNAQNLLICSNTTQTCVCGDPAYAVLNEPLPPYKVEDSKCYRTANTFCGPPPTEPVSKCMAGTTCTAKADGSTCTMSSVVSYIMDRYNPYTVELSAVTRDLIQGKVCSCQVNAGTNDAATRDIQSSRFNARLSNRVRRSLYSDRSTDVSPAIFESVMSFDA